jgi:site-specific DNA recombinase
MRRVTKINPNEANLTTKPRLRVAAYCRVSTDSEEQLASLETQKSHYEAYIKANPEWVFAGIYYDEGITGTKKAKRAELQRLLSDCENRKIDFIVTKSISRFVRNTLDCLEIIRKLNGLGIHVYFEKENINTRSMDGELMLTILSSLAENESISISQNNKWGLQRRFRNGTYKLTYPPYGLDYADESVTVNEEQAAVVRRIFKDALSGMGTQKIANALNKEGILAKRGRHWSASAVRGLLGNEKLTGDVLLQKTYTDEQFNRHANRGEKEQYFIEDHHEPIVSREDFERVAEIIRQRGKEKGVSQEIGKYQNRYVFSGKIKCSECGSSFKRRTHGGGDNKYIAWCCSKHIRDISGCSMRFIREDAIQQAFVTMINKLIFGHSFVLKPLKQSLKEVEYTENLIQIKELEKQIEENAERSWMLSEFMTKGYIGPALFNAQNNALRMEAAKLKEQKEVLSRTISSRLTTAEEVEKLLKFAVKAGKQMQDFDEELFDRFVDKIIVFSPAEIGLKMKCGLTLRERLER